MKKNILFFYVSYGSGHKTIANYIKNYFEQESNDYNVICIDALNYSNKVLKIYNKLYDINSKFKNAFIYNIIYCVTDNKYLTFPYKSLLGNLYDSKKLKAIIKKFNPDLTISTNFIPSTLIAKYNGKGIINSKLITIVTDYYAHELWLKNKDYEDAIIVSNDIVKNHLVLKGVPSNKIYPFGIPINKGKFKNLIEKEVIINNYKLNKDYKTALFFGGGSQGTNSSYEYLKVLLKQRKNLNIIFVAGTNDKLKNKCLSYVKKKHEKNIKVLGFTKEAISLMDVSDFIITKPGGATITECMEMKKPMVLIPGYGGQESYNAKYIKKKGYGIYTKNLLHFKFTIKKMMLFPSILSSLESKAQKISEKDSIKKIYDLSNKILKK